MQDAFLVGILDCFSDSFQVTGRLPARQGTLACELRKVLPFDIVHREIRLPILLANVMDGDNMRMLQAGGGFGLDPKTFHGLRTGEGAGEHHFESHRPV